MAGMRVDRCEGNGDGAAGDRGATLILLAGGASRRMQGLDKALAPFNGVPLVRVVADRLAGAGEGRPVTRVVVAAGGEPARIRRLEAALEGLAMTWQVVPDVAGPGQGPLAGVVTGLQLAGGGWHLVVACDYPFADPRLATALLALGAEPAGATEPAVDAVVPWAAGRRHPLLAAYHARCGPVAAELLKAGIRRVDAWLERLRVCWVGPGELARFGAVDRLLLNVNTPEEWQRALQLAGSPPV